jgi:hypothetical protein
MVNTVYSFERSGWSSTVSHVLIPKSKARLSTGRASVSGSVQPIILEGSPKDIAPRITFETFRPDFPNLEIDVNL